MNHKIKTNRREMKTIAPADCSFDELCSIERDHFRVGDFSILTDGYCVWISERKPEGEQKQHIKLPPKVFRELAGWYFEPQQITGKQ
jgi:hypothetical protein